MDGIAVVARNNGHKCFTSCPRGRSMLDADPNTHIFIGSIITKNIHLILGRITGFAGCFSIIDTLVFLKRLNRIKPDIIHLHNLHNSYICLPLLFRYIKRKKIKVVWTFHDCWPFTGRCPHFQLLNCNRWEGGCYSCPYPKDSYPVTFIDNTKIMWKLKERWFTGIDDMLIVTPSKWLAGLVKQSFLKSYNIEVIYNGIDRTIFHPTIGEFRSRYGLGEKQFVILGIASSWSNRKGLDVFIEMASILDSNYRIVLVGTNERIDKMLPSNIISIHRTNNQKELAEIYSAADVFVNPTREDNFPTTNVEALACGTPVITYRTGGSPEAIEPSCGCVIDTNSIKELQAVIEKMRDSSPFTSQACIERASKFDMQDRFAQYVNLYSEKRS